MHRFAESDIRGLYCALVVAQLTNILTPELKANSVEYILSCQRYDGGFSAEPGNEPHGGYTFCAIAALIILKSLHKANCHKLLKWLVNRQFSLQGGFQGRPNKLVDACYSYWVGASISLLSQYRYNCLESLFNAPLLEKYLLRAAQCETGGFRDKPGVSRDPYHTNYSLLGLSLCTFTGSQPRKSALNDLKSSVKPCNLLYGVTQGKAETMIKYFQKMDSKKSNLSLETDTQ